MAKFVPVGSFDIVIFGVTGDLSKLKLIPALFHRFLDGQIDRASKIIGISRQTLTEEEFLKFAYDACVKSALKGGAFPETKWAEFASMLTYIEMDATQQCQKWAELKNLISDKNHPCIFYLAVSPHLYVPICNSIAETGTKSENARVVLEKPIGTDLQSAIEINQGVRGVFDENSIFRMDHYLGKETVQNLLVLRFANTMFEPLWSNNSIDHVQITVSETLGVENRHEYYDKSGAVRDIMQNHLLQLLCLTAMEAPISLKAEDVREEKIKVLRALKGFDAQSVLKETVRGQYISGHIEKQAVSGYTEGLPDKLKNSTTETFVAIKTEIENWRWAGVPFYLRTGKRMAARRSEIVIQFKPLPHNVFGEGIREPNRLVIRLQPDEGMRLYMQIKEPGPGILTLKSLPLDLSYAESFAEVSYPDAYERLLMDVVRGNLSLFMGHNEVEAAWQWTDNLLQSWDEANQPMETYMAGTNGPLQSAMLLDRENRAWWEEKA